MTRNTMALLVVGLLVLGVLLWGFLAQKETIKNYPSTKGGPIVMLGDSLVAGVGASAGHTLPEQLGALIHTPVLNAGVSGDTTRDGLKRLSAVLAENPKVVIVLLGGNDFLQKIPREETFQNLEKIVQALQAQGAIVMVLGVRSGIIGGGADQEFEDLAEKTQAAYMSDVLAGIFGDGRYMSDALHPNDAGYAKIAERLAPLLQKLLH